MKRYILIDHTADLGAFFNGADAQEVFVNAGLALFDLMVEHPPGQGRKTISVALDGADQEDLLVRWLNELLYLFQVRGLVLIGVKMEDFSETRLAAELTMTPFDLEAHGLKNEIKAATYHQLELRPTPKGWRAQVIFDL